MPAKAKLSRLPSWSLLVLPSVIAFALACAFVWYCWHRRKARIQREALHSGNQKQCKKITSKCDADGGAFGFPIGKWKDHKKQLDTWKQQVSAGFEKAPVSTGHTEDDDESSDVEMEYLVPSNVESVPKDPSQQKKSSLTSTQQPVDEAMETERFDQLLRNTDDAEEFMEHLPAEIRKARYRKTKKSFEQKMTDDERQQEAALKRKQIEEIFKLMQEQKDKFGMQTMDDIQDQMKLYAM